MFLAFIIRYYFTNSFKLRGFKFEHLSIHFSSKFVSCETVYHFQKRVNSFMYFYGFLFRKIIEILQLFQCTKIYETMENVGIALFYRIFLLAAIISITLLILKILSGDECLISIFHFACKAVVCVCYSVYQPFPLSERILSCSLRFITFLALCTLRLIILFLRFLFYCFIFAICVFGF